MRIRSWWVILMWHLEELRWRFYHSHRDVEISLLVPFQDLERGSRTRIWHWTRRYWRDTLPHAEIVVGRDDMSPFSKTAAINQAARRARGNIYVILDADAYLRPDAVLEACERIHEARRRERPLWFVPYRHFYRLTKAATERVLESSPDDPYRFSSPPPEADIEHIHRPRYGHHYGAMIMIVPAEAFWLVGGMDPRYRGWGAEDVSFMFALDTLYGFHRTIDSDVFHLNHDRIGRTWETTMWPGQTKPMVGGHLASRYNAARRDKKRMRALVDEGFAELP